MRVRLSLALLAGGVIPFLSLGADVVEPNKLPTEQSTQPFEPFTGKVTANRVRLRLQPSLEGPILQELEAGQLFVVTNVVDDFYVVAPLPGTKAYIFRTYVLDGVVEGQNINVRLEPDLQSYIIAQLHAGDKVNGTICEKSNKWLQIDIPESARFYVSKDYLERVGDKNFYKQVEASRKQIDDQLDAIEIAINQELKKQFNDIQLSPLATKLRQLLVKCAPFPKERTHAEALLKYMQEKYLEISLGQEGKGIELPNTPTALHPIVITPSNQDQKQCAQSAVGLADTQTSSPAIGATPISTAQANTPSNAPWATPFLIHQEETLIQEALAARTAKTREDFYNQEAQRAQSLRGVLTRYERHVKNRPGDFLLIDSVTHVPTAFIYSTAVDLNQYVGKNIELKGTTRPSHNFAFPTYFIVQVK